MNTHTLTVSGQHTLTLTVSGQHTLTLMVPTITLIWYDRVPTINLIFCDWVPTINLLWCDRVSHLVIPQQNQSRESARNGSVRAHAHANTTRLLFGAPRCQGKSLSFRCSYYLNLGTYLNSRIYIPILKYYFEM